MCSLILAIALTGSTYEILHVPNDAVIHALSDVIGSEEEERKNFRYVWISDGKKESIAAVSYTLNTAWSRASAPITYKAIAGNQLIRVDFRRLRPKREDRILALQQWDQQAIYDPYFYNRQRLNVKSYVADDGKIYDYVFKSSFGSQVDLKSAAALQLMTNTSTPIQRYDRFVVTSLTQFGDGDYYKIAGIRKSQDPKLTDFQQFAFDHGVDLDRIDKLNANDRIALLISEVTGKPRAAQDANGPFGAFVWTEDVKKGNKDPRFHAIKTLINMKKDAIEAIALKANGHCDYAIFDGNEKLVDTVPDVIATDDTISSPFEKILEPAMSCIRCHDKENANGFRTVKNDVELLRLHSEKKKYRFDIVGDKNNEDVDELFDKLFGMFQGNLDRLNQARIDHSKAVFKSTNGHSITDTFSFVQDIDDSYRFTYIDAQIACRELGLEVNKEEATEYLEKLLPPESVPLNGEESDTFGFLILGAKVTRQDWELAYPDAALRSRQYYETLAKEKVKK